MAEQALKYPIEVTDKFSAQLRKFQRELDGLKAGKPLVDTSQQLREVTERVRSARDAISNGLQTALSSAGIAATGLAGALGLAAAAVRSFSANVSDMKAFSRETGFTVNTIRTLESAATRFQVEPGNVRAGLKAFSENLYDFRRLYGEVYPQILRLAPDLAGQLRKASPEKALDIALDYLARIPDRQTAGRISQLLFGTDQIARFGQEGVAELRRILKDTSSRIGTLTDGEIASANAFDQAVKQISNSLSGLGKTIATKAAPFIVPLIQKLDAFIANNQGAVATGLRDAITSIADGARAFNNAIVGSIGWENLIKGVIAIKLFDTAASLGAVAVALGRVSIAAKALPLLALGNLAIAAGAGYATIQGFRLGAREDTGPLSLQRMQLARQRLVLESLISSTDDPKRRAELEAKRDAIVKEIDALSRRIEEMTASGAEKGVRDFAAKNAAGSGLSSGGSSPFGGGGGGTPGGAPGGGTGSGGGGMGVRGGATGASPGGGTPGANYMRGALPGPNDLTKFTTKGGRVVTVNKQAAASMKGFLDEMEAAGAPLGNIGSHGVRRIAGSGRMSQHAYGNAVDVGSQTARDVVSPAFAKWVRENREKVDALTRKWNIVDGSKFRSPDLGHFEWNPNVGDVSRAAKEAGATPSSRNPRPASIDIGIGTQEPQQRTNNSVPLFRQMELNRGTSMAPTNADR